MISQRQVVASYVAAVYPEHKFVHFYISTHTFQISMPEREISLQFPQVLNWKKNCEPAVTSLKIQILQLPSSVTDGPSCPLNWEGPLFTSAMWLLGTGWLITENSCLVFLPNPCFQHTSKSSGFKINYTHLLVVLILFFNSLADRIYLSLQFLPVFFFFFPLLFLILSLTEECSCALGPSLGSEISKLFNFNCYLFLGCLLPLV